MTLKYKLKSLIFILFMLPVCQANAQGNSKPSDFGIGFEIAHWQPSNLDNDISTKFIKKLNTHPYIGLMFMKLWRYDLGFRLSTGYWRYSKEVEDTQRKTAEIISILFDLKYALLTDVRVSPYVSYGLGCFLGNGNTSKKYFQNFNDNLEVGFGGSIGTGFDFGIMDNIDLVMEFRYHYVRFNEIIAFTNNFSGPKINLALLYFF